MKFEIKSIILLKKGFHSEPVYNEKYLRTKIKYFYFRLGKNYYSQVF